MTPEDLQSLVIPKEQRVYKNQKPKFSKTEQVKGGVTQGLSDIAQTANLPNLLLQALAGANDDRLTGQYQRAMQEAGPDISESDFIALASEDTILPPTASPTGMRRLQEEMQQPDRGLLQEGVRRLTRSAPAALGGLGVLSNVLGSEAKGMVGQQAAKAVGLGETGQMIADIAASGVNFSNTYKGPRAANKLDQLRNRANKQNKLRELYEFGKREGLTDAQLTLLSQSDKKQNLLTRVAERTGKTQALLGETENVLGGFYNNLKSGKAGQTVLSDSARSQYLRNTDKIVNELPSNVRSAINKDYTKLSNSMVSGEDLINFYQQINDKLGPKTKQLVALKEATKKGLRQVNPQLAKDFDLTNKLYSRYATIANKLQPSMFDTFLKRSAPFRLMYGVATGSFSMLAELAGEKAARSLATNMLSNPKFQNLSSKWVNAINNNNFNTAYKLSNQLASLVNKDSPEVASVMRQLTVDDFKNLQKKEVRLEDLFN